MKYIAQPQQERASVPNEQARHPATTKGIVAYVLITFGLACFFCTIMSARIYRFGILMYGQKPGLGTLIKLVRMQ